MSSRTFKIILVGESGVGKTSIIYRYLFDEYNQEILATTSITAEKKEIIIDEEKITLEIWDTCGQEKYRSLANLFFTKVDAAILVYDCTSKNSFEQLKEYWYDKIEDKNIGN